MIELELFDMHIQVDQETADSLLQGMHVSNFLVRYYNYL